MSCTSLSALAWQALYSSDRTRLEHEPDQRHAERTNSELELETCKSVSTPRVHESVSAARAMMVEGAEMDDKEVPRFRALAARLNYLTREKARSFACVQMHAQEYDTGGLACHVTSRSIPHKERREWCSNSIGRATTPISRVTPAQTGQATVRT